MVSANLIELMGGVPIRNNLMVSAMSTSPGDSGLVLTRGEDSLLLAGARSERSSELIGKM